MFARVSIIMGIYNCESTLAEAIDSILSQTYMDWKLIMCDDGSEDNTYKLAERYQKKYSDQIILIMNDRNRGLNYTLNHCLKYADTEYVARMDGDDISLPTRLEKEVEFLDSHPKYAVVSCPMIYFDENGEFMLGKETGEPTLESMVRKTPFCHAPCMVKTEAYKTVKGYTVEKKLLRMEDYHLWMKMYLNGYVGYNLLEPLYMMRDDRNASRRRKYRYRINEAYVRSLIIKKFNLPKKNLIYCLRPLVVGLLPTSIYEMLHKRKIQK